MRGVASQRRPIGCGRGRGTNRVRPSGLMRRNLAGVAVAWPGKKKRKKERPTESPRGERREDRRELEEGARRTRATATDTEPVAQLTDHADTWKRVGVAGHRGSENKWIF